MPRLFASSRVLLDVLEWYSHSIFLEDSTQHDILYASEQVERMTDTLQLPTEGRIWNRLLLSMLVQNVCTRSTMDGEASLYNMSKTDWLDLLSNLQTCRAQLLKGNASTHPPQGHDTPDPDYLQLPMFQEVYMEVEDLVTCHVVLSDFRCALNQSNGDNVSQLLQDFTKALPKQFHGDLVPYLAKDVLSSPKKHTNVARKLSSDLEFLLLKQNDKLYSYNTLQRKCKTLCRTWNECILGIPTLAKLGYGGMAKSRFTEEHDDDHDDTKTVSSWGMDEEEEAARKEVEESSDDDYHTADEEDDDDDRKTKSHMHHEKVLPMEIRPRESWKEDFTMIENLQQHVRTDDDDEEENEFDDEPPRKRKSHVRQVTDDPVIQAARERRQKRRRLRNRRTSSRTTSATSSSSAAAAKKRQHDDNESSTTESEDAPSDALDRLPTYAETKRKQQQQQKQPSRTFTKQQIQVLQEGVETHGDNAWDIIIGEAKGGILRDKKPWQCRQYYQQNMMMSEEL